MRRITTLLLLVMLVGCGSGAATFDQPTPNARQETATVVAARAAANVRTPLPTVTPTQAQATSAASTTPQQRQPTATANLAPITITPLPTITPLFSPTPTQTPPPSQTPTPTQPPPPTATATPAPPSANSGSLLFNRNGAIWDYNVINGQTRQIIASGTNFRISPNGKYIAFMRDDAVFYTNRDGSNEQTVARNITEAPVWSPDSTSLALVSGTLDQRYPVACGDDNQIIVVTIPDAKSQKAANGCQPAWHPDSKRLAYITPQFGDLNEGFNTLALVNREGGNGWTPVSAPVQNGTVPDARRFMYAPFWKGDGSVLHSFGFIGYRLLTDVSTLEQINPFSGGTLPIGVAFDVQPATVRANRDGSLVGYVAASAKGTLEVAILPTSGVTQTVSYVGTPIELQTAITQRLEYASALTWSPNNLLVAVVYCESPNFICTAQDRADIRLFDPRTGLTTTIIDDVDPNSAIEWAR